MAQYKDYVVRRRIAKNSNTSSETLSRLATDKFEIKYHVARHNNTSLETLSKLATDLDYLVRQNVAENKNTDVSTLIQLTHDLDSEVSNSAKENLKDRDILGGLLGESKCYDSFEKWRLLEQDGLSFDGNAWADDKNEYEDSNSMDFSAEPEELGPEMLDLDDGDDMVKLFSKIDNLEKKISKYETKLSPLFESCKRDVVDDKVISISIAGKKIIAKVASTEETQRKGFTGTSTPPTDSEGILFVYPEVQEMAFWMKGVKFPLDILFFDKNMKCIDHKTMKPIGQNVPDHLVYRHRSSEPAMFAFETAAGWFDRHVNGRECYLEI